MRLLSFGFILGTIPVALIGMISYYIAGSDIESKVKESNRHILLQTQMRIEQTFKTLEKSVLQFSNTPMVKSAISEQWTVREFEKVNTMTTGLLNLQTSVLVNQAYFANLDKGWVVGLNLFKPMDSFQYAAMFRSYAQDPKSLFVVTDHSAERSKTMGDPKTLTMVQKVPLISNLTVPKGLIVVEILQEDILTLLAQSENFGYHYMIDQSGTHFLGTEEQQKEYGNINRLITGKLKEGEEKSGSFHSTVHGDEVMVTYQTSAYNGWIYVSTTPMSVVTKETRNIAFLTFGVCLSIIAFVLVSVFYGSSRMYRPIRNLLDVVKQTGVESPGGGGKNELNYIESSVRTLWNSRSQLQQQVVGQIRYLKEYLVLKLFIGQTNGEALQQQAQLYGFPQNWRMVAVMTVQIDSLQKTRYGEHDKGLLLFAINNMVGELLAPEQRFDPILFDQSQVTLVTLDETEETEGKEQLYRLAEKIQHEVMHYLQLQVSIGISRPFSSLSHTVRAYGESLAALKSRISLGYGIIVHYDDFNKQEDSGSAVYSHLSIMEDRIVHHLKTNETDKREEAFHTYLDALFEKESYLSEHVAILLQLIAKTLQLVREQGVTMGKLFDGDRSMSELSSLNTREEIETWFRVRLFEPVASMLAEQEETQYINIANRMTEMIHEGFQSDLSLELCAKLLNYHPVYLSRVFKKHMGVAFSDYLSDYRMNWAKQVLETTDLKISEISEKLQYKNTSAFIRTFRKAVGMTPGQYRDLRKAVQEQK
jgi:AraC-like DNA-binding protein